MTAARTLVTAGVALDDATARLRDAASPTARLDAELLVAHVLGRDRSWLHAHPEAALDVVQGDTLDAAVARRATGEPIAYIRGFKDWFGLRLATDRRALIPRPETELVAETAIAEIAARLVRDDAPVVAWDLATGCGAVAVALAVRFRAALALGRLRLVASDLSPDALELAAENLEAHRVGGLVTLASGDLLESAGGSLPRPEVLTANLPYLRSDEVERGEGSLRHEPRRALDGGADGLDVVRRLIATLPVALAPGAVTFLEVGIGQAAEVELLIAEGLPGWTCTSLRDLRGIDRVVRLELS